VRELIVEFLLRLPKVLFAAIAGVVFWLIGVGPLGMEPSGTLALLCWLSGAAFILLVQEGPI
jgi:hypothetical protein